MKESNPFKNVSPLHPEAHVLNVLIYLSADSSNMYKQIHFHLVFTENMSYIIFSSNFLKLAFHPKNEEEKQSSLGEHFCLNVGSKHMRDKNPQHPRTEAHSFWRKKDISKLTSVNLH